MYHFKTHASAVWYNKLANKTVKDKFDEVDSAVKKIPVQIGIEGVDFGVASGNRSVITISINANEQRQIIFGPSLIVYRTIINGSITDYNYPKP